MKQIHNMINKLIIEITIMIVICAVSFYVFNTYKLDEVYDDVTYTDIDVLQNGSTIGINEFTSEAQIKLTVSNDSNTSEDYKVLLTSEKDLSGLEDILRVKINNKVYLLRDLKVANNYFLIDKGNMKANVKEFDLFFAVDEDNQKILNEFVPIEFVNDLTI